MNINEEIRAVQLLLDNMQSRINELRETLKRAESDWPSHQVIPTFDWHSRDEVPPFGKIWASDGVGVWLIWSDGNGISPEATAVRYWTLAYMPGPPSTD